MGWLSFNCSEAAHGGRSVVAENRSSGNPGGGGPEQPDL